MKLSVFITQQRQQILEEWVAFARTAAASSEHMDLVALRDHASEMLDAILIDLDTTQSDSEQSDKARGKNDADAEEQGTATAAQAHGAGRARSGFDVQQMISEYRALRASVLRLWFAHSPSLHTEGNEDLMRFNEGIDQALAESAASYSRVIERQLRAAHEQLEVRVDERTQDLARANESLRAEMHERKRSEELRIRLLQQLVKAQESERRRISRELHDQLGQQVTAIGLKLAALKSRSELDAQLQSEIGALQGIARQLEEDVDFIVWELRPTALDDLGLVDALDDYVTSWSSHFGVAARFRPGGMDERRLPAEIETVLYRVTQEALNNVAKHARAEHVEVVLQHGPDETLLTIADDGIGFNVHPQQLEGSEGVGLDGMSERAALVGGTMTVEAAPGHGTRVTVKLPAVRG